MKSKIEIEHRLDLLARIFELWSKARRLGDRELPKCERKELESYIKKYGDNIIIVAKEIFEKENN